MSEGPFNKPSDSDGLGPKVTDFEGALCIFTYVSEGKKDTKQYGEKPYVEVDIECVEGVASGTRSKMPPQGYGQDPTELEDHTGQVANRVLIFQGFLRGAFRGRRPGDMVLGRVVVEGKVTSVSKNDKDLKASFVLADATEEETTKAVDYLNKRKQEALQRPSTSGFPEGAPESAPAFARDAAPDPAAEPAF